MAIAKKPKRTTKTDEQAAQAFISGARKEESAPQKAESPEDVQKPKPVLLRFDPDLLARVDAAAKHRGVSRTAWVQYTLSVALDQEEA